MKCYFKTIYIFFYCPGLSFKMAARSQPPARVAMQLRSKNPKIKLRRSRFSHPDVPIKKLKRTPPRPPSKAVPKSKKKPSQFPAPFNVKDPDLIRCCRRNQAVIKLHRVPVPAPPQVQNDIPQDNIPPQEPAEPELISEAVVKKPITDEEIDKMICKVIPEIIRKAVHKAMILTASDMISQVASEIVDEAVKEAVEEASLTMFITTIPLAVRILVLQAINEAVLATITLPPPPPSPFSDQNQISSDDISLSLNSEEEDDQQILIEGDEKEIKEIEVRSTSNVSRLPSSPAGEDNWMDEGFLDKDEPLSLPPPPFPQTQHLLPIISSDPYLTYCCHPPEPPSNMVLKHKDNVIPLFSLQLLRSFVKPPEPPEVITIVESESSAPKPKRPRPLVSSSSSLGSVPSPLRPGPSASSSRSPAPGPSVSSSLGPAPGPEPSSESDPDYDPTPKPKKRRKFYKLKRKSFH